MRHGAMIAGFAAALVLVLPAAPAHAADPACTVGDRRLEELSGLVVTKDGGYVTVNDGADEADRRRIFYLGKDCKITKRVAYPSVPRDTEDLALAPDGTVWVADIGDNDSERDSIGLWRLRPGDDRPTLYRVRYPDGPRDAETLLLNGDGSPVIVSKEPFSAGVYVPAGELSADRTTELERAGTVRIPDTSTSNPFGFPGRLVLTGGATSPDGRKAAVRTYADAFEFEVTDGDVVAALTGGEATATALPDEPQGEAIAYSPDGTTLLTVSEKGDSSAKPKILRYPSGLTLAPPSPAAPPSPSPAAASEAASEAASPEPARPLASTGNVLTVAGIAVLGGTGLFVVVLLTVGLIRRRRH